MDKTSKLLVGASLLIIFSGLGFLWFGLKSTSQPIARLPAPPPALQALRAGEVADNGGQATSSGVVGVEGERALVARVIDGDTIEVEGGKTVRLVGIDTPETVDPKRPVGCFGKEASNKTKSLVEGKLVILQKDISDTDKYGRLLRYVFLPLDDGQILFVDDYLVREGFAKVLTYPPDIKYNEQFREAEEEAKMGKKGLWGRC